MAVDIPKTPESDTSNRDIDAKLFGFDGLAKRSQLNLLKLAVRLRYHRNDRVA